MTWEPVNDLERAYRDAHLGVEETVEYLRQLRESVLIFLAPYHPEIEGTHQIGSDGTMVLTSWTIAGEEVIPIFTSPERAEEGLHATGQGNRMHCLGEMMGKSLLDCVLRQNGRFRAVVNPACACGLRFMDAKMLQSIVDGSALELPSPGELAMNGLVISLPAHQPSQLKEPLAKFFAGLPAVKAAWLFYEENPTKPFEQVYVAGLMVAGDDADEIRGETALALAGACSAGWDSRVLLMDPQDPGYNDIMHGVPPFYQAADFQPPAKLPEPPDAGAPEKK
jgi:SseB protein C-terminal domain/SseB protein N-terminal domain